MSKPFQFKDFSVDQDRCAMKIGTDGVLLGAWTPIEHHPFSILDIGAGTGVLALMLAQRSSAQVIDGLEIDADAYEQCVSNFENSPWSDRLFCYHASLKELVEDLSVNNAAIEDRYDLIISNPPFHEPIMPSEFLQKEKKFMSDARKVARFQDALPFDHLVESVSKLLSEQGSFSVVIPFTEETSFIHLASKAKLFPNRILYVRGTPTSEIKRSMIAFSFRETEIDMKELTIETSRHQYTSDYINLTKDFYLKM